MRYQDALRTCIFRYVSGSHAYGTARPDSDRDVRGVFVAPLEQAFRLYSGEGEMGVQEVRAPEGDEVLYELRKFMKLATDCNPNILEAFWIERGIEVETPPWRKLRAHRHLFLSRKARHTFTGYAFAQLKRLRNHRQYALHPVPKPERRHECTIPEKVRGSLLALGEDWVRPEHRQEVLQEKEYQAALEEWQAYTNWEKSRNPARRQLEEKFGYDSKHAAHLVRLMRMAVEILETGEVHVHRPDAEDLKAIMNGAWTFERLEEFADATDQRLNELYPKSPIPHAPDRKAIEELYMELCEDVYHTRIRGVQPTWD